MTFARPLALSLALLAYIIPRSKWTRRGGRLFIPHRARAAAVSSGIASKKRGTGRGGRGGREGGSEGAAHSFAISFVFSSLPPSVLAHFYCQTKATLSAEIISNSLHL